METVSNKQKAQELFASTTHNVLFANKNGEFFTSENNGSLSLKKGETLQKFERTGTADSDEDEKGDEKGDELNAKDTIAKIKASTTVEDLKAFDGDERKSVMAEYEKQLAKLVAEINVDLGKGEAELKV